MRLIIQFCLNMRLNSCEICVKSFNFVWIRATNFGWKLEILCNLTVSEFVFKIVPIFFPISVKEKCCPMSHSFVTIVVVVMLEVVEILSYPYFSIHHVDGKIKNSTKLLEAKRFKQWGRFTNKQLFAIFDGQQISGLYSIEEEGHFELNYKS